jgi:hypothetical protein
MDGNTIRDRNAEVADLEAVELRLLAIDADELDDPKRNELADELHECSTNLLRLRNADLRNLSEPFKGREPELQAATSRLKNDLQGLENAVEVIDTVSAAMGTITEIVKLIAVG